MATKLGTIIDIKGFILNKLFVMDCKSTAKSRHGHMPERYLRGGYPPQYHGLFPEAIRQLYNDGFIDRFPHHTGRGSDPHVAIYQEKLAEARPRINAYRKRVGRRRLRKDLTEFP
jgi:hypothetical protein